VLTKLLATHPGHALHRDQVLDILWRDVPVESAVNSFAKALHAARRAFEPDLQPRESSAYIQLKDGIVLLDTDHVVIDADQFEQLADSALRLGSVSAYETALAAYRGDLLPEDRYADWSAERRNFLAELRTRLLIGLADALEKRGAHSQAVDRLRGALREDPARESVHRRLMRLYVEMGNRAQAVRQFEICREVLHRQLHMAPERETEELYEDLLANRATARPSDSATEPTAETPFVDRDAVLRLLHERLARAEGGRGGLILVTGEAGVGKSRLVAEFVAGTKHESPVLWGGSAGLMNHLPYGSFALALEGYAAGRPDAERHELARRYPELVHVVPSLGTTGRPPLSMGSGDVHMYVLPAVVRLLSDLAETRPVVVVLGDLQDAHPSNLELLQFLAQLAVNRRWLIVGTSREEGLQVGTDLRRVFDSTIREGLCLHIELERLTRRDCDQLVRALLPRKLTNDVLLERIYTLSLGNPFFVEELAHEVRERNERAPATVSRNGSDVLSGHVPSRVRGLVETRIAGLEQDVRRVLALAAAAGTQITLTDLASAAGALDPPLSDAALFDALDRALKDRILEERHEAYAFRDPLVQEALYEGLWQHRRVELHTALGRSNGT
jgi:DNA-binding SARP family transcriptional activator